MICLVSMTPWLTASTATPAAERQTLTPAQKKAETNVTKLLAHARAARRGADFRTARVNYDLTIEVLEEAYGADHPRLLEPLHEMAEMFLQQYDLEYQYGHRRDTAALKNALAAQGRIVGIYEHAQGIDPTRRVEALEQIGGCYLLLRKDPEALASYAEAWRLQAETVSRESADERFAAPQLLGFYAPHNEGGHEPWIIRVTYSVGADTRVSVVDVQGDDVDDLRHAMRKAFEETRGRPRFVGGVPVATEGLIASWSYLNDGRVTRSE
jgi:hypothetical protein